MGKKIKLYVRKAKGQIIKVDGRRHPLLVSFINSNAQDSIERYNKLSTQEKQKNQVHQYKMENDKFVLLQKELGIKRTEITIFYNGIYTAIFSIATLRLAQAKKRINISKEGKITEK